MKDLKKRFLKLSKRWPFFVILLASFTFFHPVIFQNKVALPVDALVGAHVPWTEIKWEAYPAGVPIKNQEITDSFSQFYPWRGYVADAYRRGEVPLWNPYMFAGTPFLATIHSSVLYPLNLIFLFLDDIDGWNLLVFLQILFSAVFMYIFLINLNLSKLGSVIGSLAFAFSGYMIAWLEFATGGQAGLWLPLLLLFELKFLQSKKFFYLVLISIIFFFVFTAGDFQVPIYISITYFLFGLYLIINDKEKMFFKNCLKIFLGFVGGVFLAAPQILPAVELFLLSIRAGDPYIKEYFFGIMHWEKIVNFIWPDFFGNVVTRNYWGKFGSHEYLAFVGMVPLVFASCSLFLKKIKFEIFFWLLLLTALLFLFPTPFSFLIYELEIPALSTSSASRIIFLVGFCLATLSAFGITKWERDKGLVHVRVLYCFLIISLGVFLGIFSALYYISTYSGPATPVIFDNLRVSMRNMVPSTLVLLILGIIFSFQRLRQKILVNKYNFIFAVLIIFLTASELLRFAWKNTPFSPREFVFPETKTIEFLKAQKEPFRTAGGIPLNLFMPFRISSVEGYDSIYPRANGEWFSAVNHGNLESLSRRYGLVHDFSTSLINYANLKYVVDYRKNINGEITADGNFYKGVEGERYKPVFQEGRITVFENKNSYPRVWMTNNYKVITDKSDVVRELSNNDDRVLILDQELDFTPSSYKFEYQISEFNQNINQISFKVNSEGTGLLFLSESFYPGWTAFIDGDETNIYRANLIFQSIVVPKGESKVTFKYGPQSFKTGTILAITTLLTLAAGLLYCKHYCKSRKL